jgi:hypothetical protein
MTMTKKTNDWERRFGAQRRATDRKLLAECERSIAIEEVALEAVAAAIEPVTQRQSIATAFGRPWRDNDQTTH